MAIKNKQELLDSLTAMIGEDKNDQAIAFVEDMTDTIDDYESRVKDSTDWRKKYEENDQQWRSKYISRFKDGVITPEEPSEPDDEERQAPRTYEELFSVKEN